MSRRAAHKQGLSTLNRLLQGKVVEGRVVESVRWPGQPGSRPVVTAGGETFSLPVPVLQDYAMIHLGYEPGWSGRSRDEFNTEEKKR